MASELNQWGAALSEGKLAEMAFATLMQKYMGIKVTRNNIENIKAEDCKCEFLADIKFLRSPYPSAKTPAGLDRDEHLTLDVANVDKYSDETTIVMIVDYTEAGVETEGFYFITAGEVRSIIQKHPERVYSRSARTSKDKVRKVGISTNEACQIRFGNMTGKETGAAFIAMVDVIRDRNTRMKESAA